ncbi:hypothetical protein EW145_g6892 [Phellinidium pouzarii]|uniref:Uncharacterized protein n=1 Tax=Phellinidium pouzarii TaxID=167371 RepID=A0A4S4KT82_9AGAM|nr:hypothetical protein EW145_g6892 [Phellinidium pouzarii]
MKLGLLALTFSPIAYAYTYGLGTSWSIGTGSSSTIEKVTTTLNAGIPPSGQLGELILWPALSNGTGDLLMTSVESWSNQSWCGGVTGQWCIRTQVFHDQKSTFGAFAPLSASEPVTITFERNPDASGWTQSAIVNNNVVSMISSSSGPMTLFGMSTECDDYCAMTVSPQTYTNTTIILDVANPTWGATEVIGSRIYGDGTIDTNAQQPTIVDGITSSEDGKVWTITNITIPQLG